MMEQDSEDELIWVHRRAKRKQKHNQGSVNVWETKSIEGHRVKSDDLKPPH